MIAAAQDVCLVHQLHDEVLLYVRESLLRRVATDVRVRMESAWPLPVKLVVNLKSGANWADLEPLRL